MKIRTHLFWIVWLAAIVSSSAASSTAAKPSALDPCESPVTVSKSASRQVGEPNLIERACELIYQGKFESAGELIKQSNQDTPSVSALTKIVEEWKAINQRRQSARENAYREQLTELEKLKAKKDANDVKDVNDKSLSKADQNDVNDIVTVLSVVARASEVASQAQREQLVSDAFVKETFQKAIDKAAQFEVKSKWLEAYTNCYYWLQVIEPNNKAYSDYAGQLLDKATIAASFQDSPCETTQQRYEGVQKDMFIRAINALSLNYVSIIDYGQMTTKALERCKLLADVLEVTSLQTANSLSAQKPNEPPHQLTGGGKQISEPQEPNAVSSSIGAGSLPSEPNKAISLSVDSKKLAAWSVALSGLKDEISQTPTGFTKDKFIEVFEKTLALNAATADLPQAILVAQFSEAALAALDPYTVMVWPKQVQDFEKMMTNEFTGIGIEISREKGLLTVASLLPDTPAYKSGLDAGDVIETVDGVDTKDMSLTCAVHKITGPKATKVTLAVKRDGEEKPKEITITRDKITVPTLRGWQRTQEGKWLYIFDEPNSAEGGKGEALHQNKPQQVGVGYVRVTSFSGETSSDLEKVLSELEAAGMKGLILDLRFNSGGLLDSAVEVTDKFLKKGLIVKTQPGPGFGRLPTYAVAQEKGTHPDYPLVILINSASASASEIVAGALADKVHKRAHLVGERTHGKGSVQGITHYPGGGAQLKYTMAYYYLPSNQRVESQEAIKEQGRKDWGVGPNVEVLLTSEEIKKMIDVQRDNDVLVQSDRNTTSREIKKHTFEETLAADPQLAIGLLVIKTKLIQADARLVGAELAEARLKKPKSEVRNPKL
jgi:carboxyl-terminal processing protease